MSSSQPLMLGTEKGMREYDQLVNQLPYESVAHAVR